MDWLNYHHLLYFWQVAPDGSVVRAARTLHLSQPTVSAQVRALERAIGQKLFQKQGRYLVLTEVGRQVLRYAEEIFALGRELTEVVGGGKPAAATRFAVGISDALPKMTTYKLLEPALVLEPRLRIVMKIDKTERLLTQLAEHGLDLVLADDRVRSDLSIRAFTHLLGESGVSIFATRRAGSTISAQISAVLARSALARADDEYVPAADTRPMVLRTQSGAANRGRSRGYGHPAGPRAAGAWAVRRALGGGKSDLQTARRVRLGTTGRR